jgi:hypothetical protein
MKPSLNNLKFLFVLLFSFLPTHGYSQQEGLSIGHSSSSYVYLSLGMPKDIVLEKLKGFHVSQVPDSNSYGIAVKSKDSMGELYIYIGSISFADNKLDFISRSWFQSQNEAQTFELTDKLYHLLKEEMGRNTEIVAKIKTKSTRDPDKELKSIDIFLKNRKISLLITDSTKKEWGRQISINEAISDKPFKY